MAFSCVLISLYLVQFYLFSSYRYSMGKKGVYSYSEDVDSYVAHISEDGRSESVDEHCRNVADLAAEFASVFTDSEQGRLVGFYHDYGKYSEAFQRRIHGFSETVDHSSLGAYLCYQKSQIPAAFAVMGHHSGLLDLGSRTDVPLFPSFWGRINKASTIDVHELVEYPNEYDDVSVPEITSASYFMAYTRMLFSCLVDADYLVTDAFNRNSSIERSALDFNYVDSKMMNYISDWFPPRNAINESRCSILNRCMDVGEKSSQGLFELTVPTGAGKTLSSFAFAIKHALAHDLGRIIYVIPYTSVIEQTAQIFREIFGDDLVLEHHFLVDDIDIGNSRSVGAVENWDAPIVVTTNVQFFESLYGAKPSKCRKLHNIARSVVIFDEAQMIPTRYLMPCVNSICNLVEKFNVSAVLCSATQPALRPYFKKLSSDIAFTEICPVNIYDSSVFARVSYEYIGRIEDNVLGSKLMEENQVLCVVNTREEAQKLFDLLKGEGNFHLSTLMYPEHRKRVIAKIRKRLVNGNTCRVVSTSLIEAGVDIDFPMVYREICGFDSIIQSAGRCNREGKLSKDESIVRIFESNGDMPQTMRIPVTCASDVIRRFGFADIDAAVGGYFSELYDFLGADELDAHNILSDISGGCFPFKTVSRKFKLIDADVHEVVVPVDAVIPLLQLVEKGTADRSVFRKLSIYSVSLYGVQFRSLLEDGYIEKVTDFLYRFADAGLYSNCKGIRIL